MNFLIHSNGAVGTTGDFDRWKSMEPTTVTNLIKGIVTSSGDAADQQELYRAMISGVPSPWSRVLITKNAFMQRRSALGSTVLDECYKIFISEWRGLIAAYALHPDSFEFSKKIDLKGSGIAEAYGDMSVLDTYGKMLFDESFLWKLKPDVLDEGNPPCIQILYYKTSDGRRLAVGATTPYNLLFASVSYRLSTQDKDDIPWIVDGKFSDPMILGDADFKVEDAQRLYSFLNNISMMLIRSQDVMSVNPDKYYQDYLMELCRTHNKPNVEIRSALEHWQDCLTEWKDELAVRISRAGKSVNSSIPISVPMPEGPLAKLLDNERTFYFSDDAIFTAAGANCAELSSSEILLQGEVLAAWKASGDALRDYSKSPVYYLYNQGYYFAIPLSEKALNIFRNNIQKMVSANNNENVKLFATVNGTFVDVELKAKLDMTGDLVPICKRTYRINVIPEDGKVLAWPNFKSQKWQKYFYYSEFPQNVAGVRMRPRFEGGSETRIIEYPVGRVSTTMHKYEIIESTTPLFCVDVFVNVEGSDSEAGKLIIKTERSDDGANGFGDSAYLKNMDNIHTGGLGAAIVGFDFGSTNSCAYYLQEMSATPIPVTFENRRLALVGFDKPSRSMAEKDELLFVSNEGTLNPNGQVKSWLLEHDSVYLAANEDQALSAAVPVNECNIIINDMDDHSITTNAGRMYYNMKWLSDERFNNIKASFTQMLWYQICADLLANGLYPKELRWSFPTAMSGPDVSALSTIFQKAATLNSPYCNLSSERYMEVNLNDSCYTEAEADAAYAAGPGRISLENSSQLFFGIDVGGSTSDIFIMNQAKELLAQSSVRMASGFFFKAINSSAKFRKAVYDFHNGLRGRIKVLNIEDIISPNPKLSERASHYLNNVFDQLSTENDFNEFYVAMQLAVPAVFALPTYVTGILLFYSGMLVRNAIEKNGYQNIIKSVEMKYYGKGGRLFEWVNAKFGVSRAEAYYGKCFRLGLDMPDVTFHFNKSDLRENKSEVAMGLSSNHINGLKTKKDEEGIRIVENFDIIGESGLKYTSSTGVRELNASDVIPDDMFANGMTMEFPSERHNINKFLDTFISFVGNAGLVKNVSALESGRSNIRAALYMQNDPEYLKYLAHADEGATYKMPLIIAEALSYLNDTLLNVVADELR